MEKNRRRKITLKSSVPITAVFVLLSSFLFPLSPTFAFTGPSQGVGSGSGAIGSDAANNVSVGTSTTKAETKFLVVASSTDTTNYAVKILDSGQGSLLIVRNDGSVGVATSGLTYTLNVGGNIYASGNVTCGGSCGAGNVAAANITSGGFNFAQSTTTGDFAFPASLGIGTSTTVSLPVGFTAYQTSTFFGKVGIGSTPLSKLDVNGGVAIGTYAGANAAPSNGLIVSGNLGVGTTNTTAKLEVNGVIGDDIQGNNQYYLNSVGSNYGFLMNNTTGVWSLGYGTSPGTLGTSVLTWNASGNVGIGTTQPSSTLHIVGGVQVTANVTTTNLTITGLTSQNCLGTSNTGAVQAGTCTGSGGSGTVTTSTVVTANYFPFWNSSNGSGLNGTSSIYQSSLNIGIGTLQPSSTLHIVGGSIIINGTNGGLAVGTTTVQSVGNIYATGNITTAGSFSGNIAATNVTAGTFAGASNFSFPSGLGIATSGTALPVAGLNVYATSSFLLGNVGVGTAQPSSTLHVVGGDVLISGTGAGLSVGTTTSANAGSVLITGNVTTTNLTVTGVTSQNCLGTNSAGVVQAGTCTGSGGSGTVTTSTVVTANYFPFWNSTNGSGLNGTSSIYQSGLSVGIGTAQPSSTLHIVSAVGAIPFIVASSTGTQFFVVTSTGRVGIGTAAPTELLQVEGNIQIDTGGYFLYNKSTGSNQVLLNNSGSGWGTVQNDAASVWSLGFTSTYTSTPGTPILSWTSGSKVGIGTTQPSSTLHVVGGGTFTTNVTSTNLTITGLAGTSGCLSVNSTGYVVTSTCSGAGNVPAANVTSGGFNFGQSTTTGDFSFPANLGIGTSTTASLPAGFTAYQTSTFFGNVGIGTSNPLYILDINPGNLAGIRVAFSMHNNQAAAADVGSKFRIAGVNDTTQAEFIGAWEGGNSNNSYIAFKNRENGATTEQLRITSAGNVGIGTAQPSSTLDVNGSSTFRNHINTTGTVPTVSASNGTGCGPGTTITGTDTAGRIVTANPTSNPSACRITFANAYPNIPACVVVIGSSSVNLTLKASTTASMLDITMNGISNTSTIIFYHCIGL